MSPAYLKIQQINHSEKVENQHFEKKLFGINEGK